jgi:hypothetical protein
MERYSRRSPTLVGRLVLVVSIWIVLCVIVLYSEDTAIKAVGFPFRGGLSSMEAAKPVREYRVARTGTFRWLR